MFVISVKSDKLKKILAVTLVFLMTVIGGLVYVSKQEALPASTIGNINMKIFIKMMNLLMEMIQ